MTQQDERRRDDGTIMLLTAFEVAGIGVCFTDEAGKFIRVNPAVCKLLGYRAEELLGKPWTMIATPALAPDPAAFYAGLLHDAARAQGEWEVRRKDGTSVSVLVSCKPIPRPEREVVLVMTFTDIHERKAAEQEVQRLNRELEGRIAERTAELEHRLRQLQASELALRASEQKYREVFNNVSEGILVVQEGRIVLANPRVERIVGQTAESLAAMSFTEFIHPDDRAAVADRHSRRMQGLEVEPLYSFRVITADGQVIWVELSAVTIEWQGRPATLSFITDITERKELETTLTQTLDEREIILENAVAGMAFLNAEGRLMWGNQAIADIFGIEVLDSRGDSLEPYYLDREDYLRIGGAVSAAVRAGRAYGAELQMRRSSGELFWAQLSGKAVNPKDLSRGTVWTVLDITSRKQAEQDIRRALEQQRELNQLKSRFVSMTSHEYRTPLATILSATELLRDYGSRMPAAEVAGTLGSIEAAVNRMTQMLDDILIIGRADAGRIEFSPTPVAIDTFCRGITRDVALAAGADPGAVEISCSVPEEKAVLDEKLLHHILGNLLSNAFKYSPEGGRVKLSVAAADGSLSFEVRDQGIGIPEESLPKLFETFHRAANVGNISGTGLGMTIVKRAVELHGGTIAVASRMGEGSAFTVKLPWVNC